MSVYFIQRGKGGPIKIGLALNFFARYKALQNYIDEPLYVRAIVDGDKYKERDYHRKFARYRLKRKEEWFSPSEEIISFTRLVLPDVIDALRSLRSDLIGLEFPIHVILA